MPALAPAVTCGPVHYVEIGSGVPVASCVRVTVRTMACHAPGRAGGAASLRDALLYALLLLAATTQVSTRRLDQVSRRRCRSQVFSPRGGGGDLCSGGVVRVLFYL